MEAKGWKEKQLYYLKVPSLQSQGNPIHWEVWHPAVSGRVREVLATSDYDTSLSRRKLPRR